MEILPSTNQKTDTFIAAIDRVTGILSVEMPAFVPANTVAAPIGVTHFKLNLAGAEIDFEGNNIIVDTKSTAELPWDNVVIFITFNIQSSSCIW